MKNTHALNLLIQQSHMDLDMIAEKVPIAREQLEVTTKVAYDMQEFLSVCQVCNIKPEYVFQIVKENEKNSVV